MNQTERLHYLINALIEESPYYANELRKGRLVVPVNEQEAFRLYRSLVNVRQPHPVSKEYVQTEDAFLSGLAQEKGIVSLEDLGESREQGIWLWQGDITRLALDAIVNAANSQMLGCFVPCHGCIDNAIHTAAGVQLRLECARIMQERGESVANGKAIVTSGCNLPAKYVIHTVGPIVQGYQPTAQNKQDLISCYESCLNAVAHYGMQSIAFCCISTGEFHYPQAEAAQTAVAVVRKLRAEGNTVNVVFNVFKDEDYGIYDAILG